MPRYHTLGKVPHKRHTVFKKENGSIHYEQLFGTIGFDGMSSLLYHLHPPTMVNEIHGSIKVTPEIAVEKNMQMRAFKGFGISAESDFLSARKPILTNLDVTLWLSSPKSSMTDYFYKNVDADEVIFIHKGDGTLKTQLGNIEFKYGDYLVIPRGMIFQIEFNGTAFNRVSSSYIFT